MFSFTKKYSGISFSPNGVVCTNIHLDRRAPKRSFIKSTHLIDPANEASFAKTKESLKSTSVIAVLEKTDYHISKIEKPTCNPKEMEHEVLWTIQDQIPFETDEAIVRWFDCPEPNIQKSHIFGIAIDGKSLTQKLNFLESLECSTVDIRIPELAKCGLVGNSIPKDQYAVLLDLTENSKEIIVSKDGALVFSKKLPKNLMNDTQLFLDDVKNLSNTIEKTAASLGIDQCYQVIVPTYIPCSNDLKQHLSNSVNRPISLLETKNYIKRRIEDERLALGSLISLGGAISYAQNA